MVPAFLAILRLHLSVAVVIAIDQPLEPEIDQSGRVDYQLAGFYSGLHSVGGHPRQQKTSNALHGPQLYHLLRTGSARERALSHPGRPFRETTVESRLACAYARSITTTMAS